MDNHTAESILNLKSGYQPEDIHEAYIAKVRTFRNSDDFESKLKELNVARDHLEFQLEGNTELVALTSKELKIFQDKQLQLESRREAKEDLTENLSIMERQRLIGIHQGRDIAGLCATASVALAFLRENINEMFVNFEIPLMVNFMLIYMTVVFGGVAYIANNRAKKYSAKTIELKRVLTRERSISRIIGSIFSDDDTINEKEFEYRITHAISRETGVAPNRSRYRGNDIFNLLTNRNVFAFSNDFYQDYIDFLLKSGYVEVRDTPEEGTIFTKSK